MVRNVRPFLGWSRSIGGQTGRQRRRHLAMCRANGEVEQIRRTRVADDQCQFGEAVAQRGGAESVTVPNLPNDSSGPQTRYASRRPARRTRSGSCWAAAERSSTRSP